MGLAEKLVDICNEISEKENYVVEPRIIRLKDKKEYYGCEMKKISNIVNASPVFKLNRNSEKITLTSFYIENEDLMRNIAKENNFEYCFHEIPSSIFF